MRKLTALAAAALAISASAALAQTIYFEEVKITIDERAREAGYFRVRIQPEGGGFQWVNVGSHDVALHHVACLCVQASI